jgi:hypothetical protein
MLAQHTSTHTPQDPTSGSRPTSTSLASCSTEDLAILIQRYSLLVMRAWAKATRTPDLTACSPTSLRMPLHQDAEDHGQSISFSRHSAPGSTCQSENQPTRLSLLSQHRWKLMESRSVHMAVRCRYPGWTIIDCRLVCFGSVHSEKEHYSCQRGHHSCRGNTHSSAPQAL